ncbi:hypothetical protein C8R48DRAFT_610431, partial [Suillus tomentosus]
AQTVATLAKEVDVPELPCLLQYFLFSQLNPDDTCDPEDIPALNLPRHKGKLQVFNSAAAMFYAPSDLSGFGRI